MENIIREFNDRGILWLLEHPANLAALMQIVQNEIAQQLDFSRAQRINRSFIPEDLQKEEVDLLFRVPYRTGESELLLYHRTEHQSGQDSQMGMRV